MKSEIIDSVIAMAVRQVGGIVLHLGGALLITRLLGPAEYGIFGGAARAYLVVFGLFQLGTAVHLVKFRPELEPDPALIATATAMLAIMGLLAAAVVSLCAPVISAWMRVPQMAGALATMAVMLPLSMVTLVPQALLERQLSFRGVAKAELLATAVNYAVAIPLAWRGWGYWAPIYGWMAQQAALSVTLHGLARHWPTAGWNRDRAGELWRFGWPYSLSIAIWQGRNLAVPLLVSRFGGAAALGYVTLAQKLVDAIGFPRTVAYRLAISVLSKVRASGRGLSRITERAMIIQVLLVGLISTVVAATGGPLAAHLLGAEWGEMMPTFRPLAIVGVVNCAFHLHCSALYVHDRPDLVNWFNLANAALLLAVALALGPAHGIGAYLAAELAALASYALLMVLAKRSIGLNYTYTGLGWLLAAVGAIMASRWGLAACLVLMVPALFAGGRADLRSLFELVRNYWILRLVPES